MPSLAEIIKPVNFRKGPSTDNPIIRTLNIGERVHVLDASQIWFQIKIKTESGWVHSRFLKLVPNKARTTSALNLREGASTDFAVLRTLAKGESVIILDDSQSWFQVKAKDLTGWVFSKFLIFDTEEKETGFLKDRIDFNNIKLEPEQKAVLPRNASMAQKRVAPTWNWFGGLLTALSLKLNIDPFIAAAVLTVESSGEGFSKTTGKMIIRFENHKFFDYWGKDNPETFSQHFQYNNEKRWTRHKWRASTDDEWQSFHGKQKMEWKVFEFARTLDDNAAKQSISMGLPQVMGFNHSGIGYESVGEMFTAFTSGEAWQVAGFFDFVQGHSGRSSRLIALQRKDFLKFAEKYNGLGQAVKYSEWIKSAYEALESMFE